MLFAATLTDLTTLFLSAAKDVTHELVFISYPYSYFYPSVHLCLYVVVVV